VVALKAEFVDVDGVRTRYLYEGAGDPVLLLHGGGVSADTWLRNIDALGASFCVCAPDLLGHGFTDAIDLHGEPPFAPILTHLRAFVDHLGWDRFMVVGSSFGALLAALMYFDSPERISAIVLVGSGSCFNSEAELTDTLSAARKNAESAIFHATLESCRNRLAKICYDPSVVPEEVVLIELTTYALPSVREFYIQMISGQADMARARKYHIRDRLTEIAVPTLVVWGREDPRGIYARAVQAVEELPKGKLVTLEKCGHMPYIEHPDVFNTAVLRFLNENAAV
jgi:2-hydroxy-6-oxonona-2,4-dienedioate hydrolase